MKLHEAEGSYQLVKVEMLKFGSYLSDYYECLNEVIITTQWLDKLLKVHKKTEADRHTNVVFYCALLKQSYVIPKGMK